jgi:hypothetical protein
MRDRAVTGIADRDATIGAKPQSRHDGKRLLLRVVVAHRAFLRQIVKMSGGAGGLLNQLSELFPEVRHRLRAATPGAEAPDQQKSGPQHPDQQHAFSI